MEIGEGEPGVTQNPDGNYTLTTPEDADLGLELMVTEDGKVSVDKLTDITPEQPNEPSEPGPQTGDNSNVWMWSMVLICSGSSMALLMAMRRKKAE